jgi:hypothetical protein
MVAAITKNPAKAPDRFTEFRRKDDPAMSDASTTPTQPLIATFSILTDRLLSTLHYTFKVTICLLPYSYGLKPVEGFGII